MNANALAAQYREELLDRVIPFWEHHSLDREYGGYFTLLDRDGTIFGTEKYVWLQGRQAWMFATLYNDLEQRDEWLEHALLGASFLRQFGRAEDGTWQFALSRTGKTLGKPYSIFSDCFAAIAFAQLARATGDDESKQLAEDTYRNVLSRLPDPLSEPGDGDVDRDDPVPMIRFALPMILVNVTVELDWILGSDFVRETTERCLDQVFGIFLDVERQVIRERVSASGHPVDNPNGRLVNPGHGIEAMWFAMDVAERTGDRELIDRAIGVLVSTLEFGWDDQFGGVFYFLDIDGKPVQELEWDQKLWWVHLETLVALAMAFRLTGRRDIEAWFHRIHDYTWHRFPDPDYGEWWGYLNRRGEVSIRSKGGIWKGCFHVPRALYRCMREFERMGSGPH